MNSQKNQMDTVSDTGMDVEQMSNLPLETGVVANGSLEIAKTSNVMEVNADSRLDAHFKKVFDEAFYRLLQAKTIVEIIVVFKDATRETGKAEFVIAMLLYRISEEAKENKQYLLELGYSSLSEFIRDLAGTGINNRTSFYNAVQIGEILSDPFFFSGGPESLTYNELFQNWSKIRFLKIVQRIIPHPNFHEDPGIIRKHFLEDTCRQFKAYIKNLESQVKGEVKCTKKEANDKEEGITIIRFDNSSDAVFAKIYQQIRQGRFVEFFPDYNQEFLENARDCLEVRYKRKCDELNKRMEKDGSLNLKMIFSEDLQMLFKQPHVVTYHLYSVFAGASLNLSPNAIKDILRNNFRRKTDYELAEAFLINRFSTETEVKEQMNRYGVHTLEDFADKFLGITESQCKRLKKIGKNLEYIEKLQGDIDLAAPGFLEKLYFVDKAFDNHKNEPQLVVRYLNYLSAKQFREFARDPAYNIKNEPVCKRDYNKALLKFEEYQALLKEHKFVAIIGLHFEDDKSLVDGIIQRALRGEKKLHEFYPELQWQDITDCGTKNEKSETSSSVA